MLNWPNKDITHKEFSQLEDNLSKLISRYLFTDVRAHSNQSTDDDVLCLNCG